MIKTIKWGNKSKSNLKQDGSTLPTLMGIINVFHENVKSLHRVQNLH